MTSRWIIKQTRRKIAFTMTTEFSTHEQIEIDGQMDTAGEMTGQTAPFSAINAFKPARRVIGCRRANQGRCPKENTNNGTNVLLILRETQERFWRNCIRFIWWKKPPLWIWLKTTSSYLWVGDEAVKVLFLTCQMPILAILSRGINFDPF